MNKIELPTVTEVTGARFPIGRFNSTPLAKETVAHFALLRGLRFGEMVVLLLARHQLGDWHEMDADERNLNLRALEEGERVLSSFRLDADTVLWLITDANRCVTTMLLASEY